ncbi:MAG TPA: hypothetical protein VK631_21170 [Solirubrobacteraceae bacterium]|nr:hypothetical protein [Solirubrobacteraceae bacterium]
MATTEKKGADAGQAQAQSTYDEAAKKGYYGSVPAQPANSEYSLQSGPDSPGALDQTIATHEAKVADMRASTAKGA